MIDDILPVSPVPGDERLIPGELPFTAFGQYGSGQMDLRVFDQDIYWVNVHGEPFYLDRMGEAYLRNVRDFLRRGVESYYSGMVLRSAIDLVTEPLFFGLPSAFELELELGVSLMDCTPDEWLASTPLMRRIESLLV